MLGIYRGPHKLLRMGRAHTYLVYSPNSILSADPEGAVWGLGVRRLFRCKSWTSCCGVYSFNAGGENRNGGYNLPEGSPTHQPKLTEELQ